jgi:ATP-dependent RNA helicase SUPV3L1/SUV3
MEKGHFVFPQDVTDHDALIVFSKKMVLACAAELQRLGISCSVIYGSLPYDVRTREVDRFLRGENRVIVATDAIGMGMNLPIRRVVFLENEKFDGENKRPLNAKEIQQIAGRAGRRGSFDVGYYTAQFDKKQIAEEVDAIVPPLKQAVLKFPEELISLNGLLSETLSQWDQMASGELYTKAKIEREIKLCKTLEKYTDDKNLIYQFLTIPFNEKSPELYAIWLRLFQSEVEGIGTPLDEILPEIYDKEPLATLELKHQICDLANFYTTRFGVEEDLPRILERKREISDRMAEILGEQNLPMRHCEMCGKELAWNNPYRICNTCHDKKLAQPWLYRGRKSRRW